MFDTNAEQTAEIIERPKLHKLPDSKPDGGGLYVSRTLVILCIAALVVVFVPSLWKDIKTQPTTEKVALSEPINSVAPPAPQDAQTVSVGNDSEKIVGQITKLPGDSEQAVQVQSNQNVDSDTGKELLKIISKY